MTSKPSRGNATSLLLVLIVILCGITARATVPGLKNAPQVAQTDATREPSTEPTGWMDQSADATQLPLEFLTESLQTATAFAKTPAPTAYRDSDIIFIDSTQPPDNATAKAPVSATEQPTAEPTTAPSADHASEATSPPSYSYETDEIRIEIREINITNVVYFAAEIWLTDPSQLRSAFSSDRFDAPIEPVLDIANRHDAVLAINGDFATFNNGGIIIRNGELFRQNRSTRHLLVIDKNGDFIPYTEPPQNTEEASAQMIADGVQQTLVFGPVLVENGQAVALPGDFFVSTGATREPRTAIAQLGPLHYLWLVVDGRQDEYSQGVSLPRLQELMIEHGAITAFNLDGGGSTTLCFNGNILNRPANGGQRHVPDILYIGR